MTRPLDRSRIGRPPLQVSLAASAAYAVGLDFGHDHIRAAVCDLSGRIVAERLAPASVDGHPHESLDLAQRLAARRARRRPPIDIANK